MTGGQNEWDFRRKQTWSATAFLSLIYFEILGLTMEDGEPVFHSQLPINCGHMRIRGFEVAAGSLIWISTEKRFLCGSERFHKQ